MLEGSLIESGEHVKMLHLIQRPGIITFKNYCLAMYDS